MTEMYQGRLELTWTNKSKRLLAKSDGTYEWVDPSDYRVAEVRLLQPVETYGSDPSANLLIQGDSLYALESLKKIPAYKDTYAGKIKLAYLDPPFNTQQTFAQYNDALEHSVWLTMMRDRLRLIRDLLSEDGSVWVHCNDSEQHRLRCVMDEVFGVENFYATFVWQKVDSPNDNHVAVVTDHDYIICYAKSRRYARFIPKPDESILESYGSVSEDGRRYRDRLLKKNGKNSLREHRPTMFFPIPGPDGNDVYPIHDDGREARWSKGWAEVQRLLATGGIVWKRRTVNGTQQWVPYTREWAPEAPTRPWPTIWVDIQTMRQAKAHLKTLLPGEIVFDTPKPELLLYRILTMATSTGDIVMDCFAGSGTTAAVAHKMGRRWVAVEWSEDTVQRHIIPRLRKVIDGQDPGGITEAVGWEGGGGFQFVKVAPSMFTEVGGRVVLAEWATNGLLSQACAAQLGFEYVNDPPFCGKKGKLRLAVVDGMVNPDVVRLLLTRLSEDEQLILCGTAVDPEARNELRQLRPGSSVRKVPSAILSGYRYRPSEYKEVDTESGDTSSLEIDATLVEESQHA